jgi:hypothetical protein
LHDLRVVVSKSIALDLMSAALWWGHFTHGRRSRQERSTDCMTLGWMGSVCLGCDS